MGTSKMATRLFPAELKPKSVEQANREVDNLLYDLLLKKYESGLGVKIGREVLPFDNRELIGTLLAPYQFSVFPEVDQRVHSFLQTTIVHYYSCAESRAKEKSARAEEKGNGEEVIPEQKIPAKAVDMLVCALINSCMDHSDFSQQDIIAKTDKTLVISLKTEQDGFPLCYKIKSTWYSSQRTIGNYSILHSMDLPVEIIPHAGISSPTVQFRKPPYHGILSFDLSRGGEHAIDDLGNYENMEAVLNKYPSMQNIVEAIVYELRPYSMNFTTHDRSIEESVQHMLFMVKGPQDYVPVIGDIDHFSFEVHRCPSCNYNGAMLNPLAKKPEYSFMHGIITPIMRLLQRLC